MDFRAVELLERLLKDNFKLHTRNKEGLHSAAR